MTTPAPAPSPEAVAQAIGQRLGWMTRLVGALLLSLVAGHLAIGAVESVGTALADRAVDEYGRNLSPAYAGMALDGFWREHGKSFTWRRVPYYHWRRHEFHGRYVDVDAQGTRRTPKSPEPGAKKVLVFGGSAVWGTAVPDGETVPAHLQRLLGSRYDVYNMGESSFVAAQELNLLLERLALGDRPDTVIFYDGANDVYGAAYSPAVPRDPLEVSARQDISGNVLLRLFGQTNYSMAADWLKEELTGEKTAPWDRRVAPFVAERVEKVLDLYDAHIKQVRALGAAYGFRTYFFWQPHLFTLTKRTMTAFETGILENKSAVWKDVMKKGYERAKVRFANRDGEGVHFLGDLFNDESGDIFVDQTHLGPAGNRAVAAAIQARITATP